MQWKLKMWQQRRYFKKILILNYNRFLFIFSRYAIDIIGSVIFGLDIDSFSDPHNEFRNMSDRLFKNPNANVLHRIRHVMNFICPP